jgi:hypothetical protein
MTIVGAIDSSTPVFWSSPNTPAPTPLQLYNTYTIGIATGISNNDQVVGIFTNDSEMVSSAYWPSLTAPPMLLQFDSTLYTNVFAKGINNNGQIVGFDLGIDDNTINTTYWSSPTAQPIRLLYDNTIYIGDASANGINNSGQIVGGLTGIYNKLVPVYWSSTTTSATPLPYDSNLYTDGDAIGINDSGQIVGLLKDKNESYFLVYWSSTTASPTLLNYDTTLYYTPRVKNISIGINNSGEIVSTLEKIDSSSLVPVYWSSSTASPILLNYSTAEAIAYGINTPSPTPSPTPTPTPTPIPVSNICFPAGTPIKTDQGDILIEKLQKDKHTINNQAIHFVTQTTSVDSYLIRFAKGSVGHGLPTQTTIMSKDHKIDYKGQLAPASRFLTYSKDITKVKYNGEILYNVLLGTYGRMQVNGLSCETLHPNNRIAKLQHFG